MQNYLAKSTKNALLWPILVTVLLSSSLSGCASLNLFGKEDVKPIEVIAKPVDKTRLDISMPDPIQAKPFDWFVITPENAESQFKKLEEQGQDVVFFAITADGYKQLSVTIADLRNLINTQRTIILQYKDYYEPAQPKTDTDTKK